MIKIVFIKLQVKTIGMLFLQIESYALNSTTPLNLKIKTH